MVPAPPRTKPGSPPWPKVSLGSASVTSPNTVQDSLPGLQRGNDTGLLGTWRTQGTREDTGCILVPGLLQVIPPPPRLSAPESHCHREGVSSVRHHLTMGRPEVQEPGVVMHTCRPALERPRKEDCEFKVNQDYVVI
jgi:hypothetical protein